MSIKRKRNIDLKDTDAIINNLVFDMVCKIQNGSISIIKQDKIVIQVNVNEKINFGNWVENESFVEETIL